jgi:hypothetical protein
MRVATLLYGLSYLPLAALAFVRHDVEFSRQILGVGAAITGLVASLDVASSWGRPRDKSTTEHIIEALAKK